MGTPKPGRTPIALGIAVMIAAFATGGFLLSSLETTFLRSLSDMFISTPLTAPIDTTVALYPGEWAVYVATGTTDQPSGGTAGVQAAALARALNPRSLLPVDALSNFDVAITAPGGRQLVLQDATVNSQDRITRGTTSYLAELKFRVPAAGAYHLVVAGNDGTRLFLAPTLIGFARMIPVGRIGGAFFCLFAFLVGLLVLIVGLVQTHRSTTAAMPPGYDQLLAPSIQTVPSPAQRQPDWPAPPAQATPAQLPPAGWYADPMRSANWRYWDGQGWTAHIG